MSGGFATLPSPAFGGFALGGALGGERRLGQGPLFVGVRTGLALATDANQSWKFEHWQGVAALSAGADHHVSIGRVWAQLGGGVLAIHESAQRHQYQRLKDAGAENLERSGWSVGPYAFLELGAEVRFAGDWSASISGGPAFTRQLVAGAQTNSWGITSQLGVSYAF